jgi:hypothetical protein
VRSTNHRWNRAIAPGIVCRLRTEKRIYLEHTSSFWNSRTHLLCFERGRPGEGWSAARRKATLPGSRSWAVGDWLGVELPWSLERRLRWRKARARLGLPCVCRVCKESSSAQNFGHRRYCLEAHICRLVGRMSLVTSKWQVEP